LQNSDLKYLPLKGRTVLIARTEEGNALEGQKLRSLGASVVEFPVIAIEPPSDLEAIRKALSEISNFDWIVFTSANGVRAFFEVVRGHEHKIRARFACVGPETQKALEAKGFEASFVPKKYLTTELGREMIKDFDLKGKKVLLARAEKANKEIALILLSAGATIVEAPVYRTTPRSHIDCAPSLVGITDITLTSPSAAEALVSSIGPEIIISNKTIVHCIGPVTAERAQKLGLKVDTTASVHTIDGLVEALVSAASKINPEFRLKRVDCE
jgi:uroporphyrinogen III methyltransferase / synthase